MESNTKEKGSQPCPYCKKEFKQLSRHAPSCKKRPENEAGTPSEKFGREASYVDHHPSGEKIPEKEERQDPDGTKAKEKPRVLCNGCGKTFIQLQKHKCTGLKSDATDNQSSPFPESSFESRPKSNESTSSSLTSVAGSDINGDSISKKDFISPNDNTGSSTFIRTRKPITDQSKGKGVETCPDCGKSFICLAKHKKCKMKNKIGDANDLIGGQSEQSSNSGSLTKIREAEEGRETQTGIKDR